MKISFNIEYNTLWGESIYVYGNIPELGDNDIEKAILMECSGNGKWSIDLKVEECPKIKYRYFLKNYDNRILNEEGPDHEITVPTERNLNIYDHWQNEFEEKNFFSSAFTHSIFARNEKIPECDQPYLKIYCIAPVIEHDQILEISGSNSILGEWDPEKSLPLKSKTMPFWEIDLPQDKVDYPFQFKFIVKNKSTKELLYWEEGENRYFAPDKDEVLIKKENVFLAGAYLNKRINWRGAGVAIPVFSLRSKEGYGIGEFNDLKKLIDWCVITNQKIIQILPINDTTITHSWKDSYPYNTISTIALNPVYINLEMVGEIKDKKKKEYFTLNKEKLNNRKQIDFESVSKDKWDYLKEIYKHCKDSLKDDAEYKKFFNKNKEWLIPYSAFSYLRDKYSTSNFESWKENSKFDQTEIEKLFEKELKKAGDLTFYCFIQYHLDKQLSDVQSYAHKNGIVIKGDIPIGISRKSVDAWKHKNLFNMNSQAGAPPDDFSIDGQNWGFPTYNWDEMAKDNYSWWRKRFKKMSDYFDAYRIDHILGFFRIWEIPENAVQGLLGYFNPANPYYPEEMHDYGLTFNKERYATPYIREYMLYDLFAEYTSFAKLNYLIKTSEDRYTLNPRFSNQKEIENYFKDQTDQKSEILKTGLLKLTTEVLFLEDPYKKGKYHPRITAYKTYSYRALDDYQRAAFNRLYDDFFYHRHNYFWQSQAMKKLPALISSTDMLVCGEDLGMIPACVPYVMDKLQILSLEIERMPKIYGYEFGDTATYPYLSVCTTSTHDMNPIRAWWEENKSVAQDYYNKVLKQEGKAPQVCGSDICQKIINNHLNSPSMFCILPLQDWLSVDENLRNPDSQSERINVPAVSRHYWRYRMHLDLDELLKAEEYNKNLKEMVKNSGR